MIGMMTVMITGMMITQMMNTIGITMTLMMQPLLILEMVEI